MKSISFFHINFIDTYNYYMLELLLVTLQNGGVMKESIGYEIKSLDNMIQRFIIKEAKNKNSLLITPVQAHIIKYLIDNEKVYQRDLENVFKFRRSTVSGILKTMEKNNLIKRIDTIEDARMKQIVLTDFAENKFKNGLNRIKAFENKLRENIDEKDLENFFKVIKKIKNNLSK